MRTEVLNLFILSPRKINSSMNSINFIIDNTENGQLNLAEIADFESPIFKYCQNN